MKISALIFDLDGTAIPNKPDGVPSQKVITAVKNAQKNVSVSIATGRPIFYSDYIFKALGIKQLSIISGGTQIYDPINEKIVWEKTISQQTVEKIVNLMRSHDYGIYISDSDDMKKASEIKVSQDERVLFIMAVNNKDANIILDELSKLPEIVAFKVKSWTKDKFDIHITHKNGTKKDAMNKLLKIIRIPKNQVMVVGDSNNDLPLFEFAGLKVAMGNGSEELKKQADFISLSVEDDGLAVAIDKFILK